VGVTEDVVAGLALAVEVDEKLGLTLGVGERVGLKVMLGEGEKVAEMVLVGVTLKVGVMVADEQAGPAAKASEAAPNIVKPELFTTHTVRVWPGEAAL
jgi:hypothetical protein